MPGSSNTSFIPKRNPAQKERQGTKRKVFVGTFVIRILFFAAILAAAGVFIYELQLKKSLDAEILALDTAIATFNEAEMQRVLGASARLSQAQYQFTNTASIASLLRALEAATVGSVQITKLALERVDSTSYEVVADMNTETFDSVLFQRSILEDSNTFVVSEIDGLVINSSRSESASAGEQTGSEEQDSGISFKALLSVATEVVPHTVSSARSTAVPVPAPEPVTEVPVEQAVSSTPSTILPIEADTLPSVNNDTI